MTHEADIQPVPALPSASILLVRDGMRGLEVLMMKRAKTMRFAPGAYVFPGGKVDAHDGRSFFWRQYLNPSVRFQDMNFRIAALRELYEEAGILYTQSHSPREDTVRRSVPTALAYAGERLAVENLILFSHWITPVQAGRRFDTHFYLAPFEGQKDGVEDGSEMIENLWVRPKELLMKWEQGGVPIMFPTRLNLMRLSEARTVAEAIEQSLRRTVVPILPKFTVDPDSGEKSLEIPAAAGFGLTRASNKDISAEAKILKRFQ